MELRVISFNIRCCDDPNGNSIPERAVRLDKVTSAYDADIICFQEMRPAWEPFIEKYYLSKYAIFNKYRAREGDVESSPILWRKDMFDCLETGYFWLSDTPDKESRGWDEVYNCYRMCVYARLRENGTGKTFVVMNTHFGFGDSGQVKSAGLIANRAARFAKYPIFITGDFNMQLDTVGYAAMTDNFLDVNAQTANDTRDTYHAYDPAVYRNQHIDYCFVNDRVTPISQRLMDETVDGKFPSDHFGLFSVLEF